MKSYLSIGALVLVGIINVCCQCVQSPPDFFDTLYWGLHTPTNNLVIAEGTIVGYTANNYGVRFVPLREYFGKPLKDTITIWGSYGDDCRFEIRSLYLPPKDTFVLTMRQLTGREGSFEELTDYAISNCGVNYIFVVGDSVFGGKLGTFAYSGFPLKAFEDSLVKDSTWLGVDNFTDLPALSCFPNPAKTDITIHAEGISGKIRSCVIINSIGQIMTTLTGIPSRSDGNYTFHLAEYPSGLYFVKMFDERNIGATIRVLKE